MKVRQNIQQVVVESPGRINLIGEHIDYNGGHVLPGAIDKKITVRIRKVDGMTCTVQSRNLDTEFSFSLDQVRPSKVEWENYILGVVHHIQVLHPGSLGGFACEIDSDLPIGSGISSSAALECGLAKGLNELFHIGLSDEQIISLSRDAEHSYVGTKCGIMDQFAVVMGKKDQLLLLDCQTLDHRYIKAEFDPYGIVLLNTNVSHNLASGEYNTRREECDTALEVIRKKYPQYQFLCDVPLNVLSELRATMPGKSFVRALFAVEENQRTLRTAKAMEKGSFHEVGACLYDSHKGLSELFEVSCEELDFLVDFSRKNEYVLGARMMGGGFGGCTINLVHKDHMERFIMAATEAYKSRFNREMTPIRIAVDDGVTIL